jgi:hypothetical protein
MTILAGISVALLWRPHLSLDIKNTWGARIEDVKTCFREMASKWCVRQVRFP